MKALVAENLGEARRLSFADVATPTAAAGEVLVDVRYAGINPADWKAAEGYLFQLSTFRPLSPFVVGLEGAGVIAAVGEGVSELKQGDRVLFKSDVSQGRWGSYAEYIAIPASLAARIPESMLLAQAASLPIAGLTCLHSLQILGELKVAERVFVHAGAGAVGSLAVQMAARIGATVLASCSPANAAYLKARGAQVTFDYRDPDMADKVGRAAAMDLVLDAVCNGQHDLVGCIARGGRYVTIPTLEPDSIDPDAGNLAAAGATHISGGLIRESTQEGLQALLQLFETGLVLPEVQVAGVDELIQALSDCKAGNKRGKTVVRLWGEDNATPGVDTQGASA